MNLEIIRNEYTDHAARLISKAAFQKCQPTHNERKGVAYYLAGAQNVQSLIDQGPIGDEGFEHIEYVPQRMQLAPTVQEAVTA